MNYEARAYRYRRLLHKFLISDHSVSLFGISPRMRRYVARTFLYYENWLHGFNLRIESQGPSDKDSICMPGAYGPLCHACEIGWFFDSNGDVTCKECTRPSALGVLAGLSSFFVLAFLGWIIEYRGVLHLSTCLKEALHLKRGPQLPFMGALSAIPLCQLKLIWSTFQIAQSSIGKNLDLSFPGPMVKFNEETSMLNLEFLDVGCSSLDTNFHSYVYSASAFPIVLVGCL